MVIIKETNKNKLLNRERRMAREVFKEVSTPKIIDFELGSQSAPKGHLKRKAKWCEAGGAHSFTREVSERLARVFANDGDVLRVAAGPLRRTHWFVAVLINLIAETFVGERRGSLPRKPGFRDLCSLLENPRCRLHLPRRR
jgi:hypothetical protein